MLWPPIPGPPGPPGLPAVPGHLPFGDLSEKKQGILNITEIQVILFSSFFPLVRT